MRYELPTIEDRPLWDIWLSMFQLPALTVADELQLFPCLAEEPRSTKELAERLGVDLRGMDVLVALLSAMGLLRSSGTAHELTDVARTYLLPVSPFYWGPLLRGRLGRMSGQHVALLDALRRQAGAPSRASEGWKSGQMTPAMAEAVTRVMHCHSLPAAIGAASHDGFSSIRRLLDVGGGSGCFSIAIAQRYPELRCSIMDLPPVCEVARRYVVEGGVADRVDAIAVDMFRDPWPKGYDGILLSNILHDWDAKTNEKLARAAFDVLPSGGKIFVHEMLLTTSEPGPLTTASFGVMMLLGTEGKQYALSELTEILERAGFADVRADAAYGYYSIVSAVRP